jgi:PIN domain nuclease of toxin-antitoxin system
MDPRSWFRRAVVAHGLREIAVDGDVAAASTMLPGLHADPCDRILVATALAHGHSILTPDPLIARYADVRVTW